jgi:ribose 5-phosphate isomerase A
LKVEGNQLQVAKRLAALEAVGCVKDGFVVGLGSGSTAAFAVEALGERVRREGLRVFGVPTSYQAFLLAVECGVPVTSLDERPVVDVVIDGADQVAPDLCLIKGMGAALVREKIVAVASRFNVIVADESKVVRVLGEGGQVVPVEVLPFAVSLVRRKIEELGGGVVLRVGSGKLGPVVSDNGNFVLDCCFGEIADPAGLATSLKMIAGVVETGLFVGLTDVVYVGSASGVKKLERVRGQ